MGVANPQSTVRAAGLPSVLDTCYFYNRSAVDDLGAILEETESEKAKRGETTNNCREKCSGCGVIGAFGGGLCG